MRQGDVLAYLAPKVWGGKREGKMEGDGDLWLSGASVFLLGTISFFSLSVDRGKLKGK